MSPARPSRVRSGVDPLLAALAALLSPLVFLSSAHDLYLRNQEELDGVVSVLAPFWVLAGPTWLLGTLLLFAAARGRGRTLSWGLLLWGPALLGLWLIRSIPWHSHFLRWLLDVPLGGGVAAAIFVAAVIGVSRRWPPNRICPWFALVASVLAVGEAGRLATSLRPSPALATTNETDERVGNPDLVNVYHVVFDALSPSLVQPAQPPGMEQALGGFVVFEDLRTPCDGTSSNFRMILGGQPNCCPHDAPADDSRASSERFELLELLRRKGYLVEAYAPRFPDRKWADQFDRFVPHVASVPSLERVSLERDNALLFRRMWAVAFIPDFLLDLVERMPAIAVRGEPLRTLRAGNLAAFSSAPLSRRSFQQFLALEPGRPAHGRYVLLHLWMPHGPHLLRGDCSHGTAANDYTDALAQTQCAMRCLMELIDMLRTTGRLEEATVIVQGDHGGGDVWRGGRILHDKTTRLHTILMVKAPFASGPARRSGNPASQCDVAPTIADVLDLGPFRTHRGQSLLKARPDPRVSSS